MLERGLVLAVQTLFERLELLDVLSGDVLRRRGGVGRSVLDGVRNGGLDLGGVLLLELVLLLREGFDARLEGALVRTYKHMQSTERRRNIPLVASNHGPRSRAYQGSP